MVLGTKNGINALVLDGVFLFARVLGTGMAPVKTNILQIQ